MTPDRDINVFWLLIGLVASGLLCGGLALLGIAVVYAASRGGL